MLGDPGKAHAKLGWKPATTFQELVGEMVRADLDAAQKEIEIKRPAGNACADSYW